MGREPGPGEDSHMWEAADVWSIMPSSHPLYTLLCVRAPWPPQSHTDKHYPNLLIYSFSLVRVGRRRRRGRGVSLPVTLALLWEWIRMFYILLCFRVIVYFRASFTSMFPWMDRCFLFIAHQSALLYFIVTTIKDGFSFCPLCNILGMFLKTASLRPAEYIFYFLAGHFSSRFNGL